MVDLSGRGGLLRQVNGRTSQVVIDWLNDQDPAWRAAITHVAMDTSATYAKAAREALPQARIVVDRFHLVAFPNRAVTDYRPELTWARRGRRAGGERKCSAWPAPAPTGHWVSTAGCYAWRNRPPSARTVRDEVLTGLITAIHQQLHRNPGVRRVWAELTAAGQRISAKRVHRLMRAVDLQGRHPRQFEIMTVAGGNPAPAPDLIGRDFTAAAANTAWCGDITYNKTWDDWAYLATVIDLHSRALVGWALDTHMRTSLITDALVMAVSRRQPAGSVIFHSDG